MNEATSSGLHKAARELSALNESTSPVMHFGTRPDGTDYRWYTCDCCNVRISVGDRYCRNCGNRIDWNGK